MRLRNLLFSVLFLFLLSTVSWAAFEFEAGGTDRVTITDNAGLTLPDNDWTVWCKIKPDTNTLTADARFLSWSASSVGITLVLPNAGGAMDEIVFTASDDGVEFAQCTSTNSPFQGNMNWTDVAMVRGGATLTGYVNASSVCTDDIGGVDSIDSSDSWSLGNRSDGARPFPGDMAGCMVWHRALTAAELSSLNQGFSPVCIPGFVLYTPMIFEYVELRANMTVTNQGSVNVAHPRMVFCGE